MARLKRIVYIRASERGLAKMVDVFVSYKREDAPRVRKLVGALRQSGFEVWWDEDIPASAPWETTIERALADAKAVIVCWSPNSVASENVRSEARAAREDGRLIQVFMKPCSPPLFFGERQGVDLSSWRGRVSDPRVTSIAESIRAAAGVKQSKPAEPKIRRWLFELRIPVAVAALLILLGSLAGWWLLSPAHAQGPQTVAVLPFRALTPADANLVDAIWDDTRGALGRNPNLRVLGREAMVALSEKHLDPAGYRRTVGADYLLDGSVEHVGDQVEMKLSLVRTRDGTEVWNDSIGGKLDDIFAFQQRIASEVEGRIRGRVAPGGGTKSENIATSGEVYAIYAEAKAKVRLRDPDNARQAKTLLRKALAIDPNFAPAWAELAVATNFGREPGDNAQAVIGEEVGYIRRALTLAPNLAYAHAALAMVQNFQPESEADLRRAIALDPGNAEAWTWLGNLLVRQNRMKEALAAQTRAVEIEPLWWTPVGNKLSNLILVGDRTALTDELARIARTQDPALIAKSRWHVTDMEGHPGDAAKILLRLRADYPEQTAAVDQRVAGDLIALGFIDEGLRARPDLVHAPEVRGSPVSAKVLDERYTHPVAFWQDSEGVVLYSRMLPKSGRLDEFVSRYRAAFKSPDEFMAAFATRQQLLVQVAPTIAANLKAGGESAQADAILRRNEATLLQWLHNGSASPDLNWLLGLYGAAEGRDDEAIVLIRHAVAGGWLPDRVSFAIDIADEPCFARLVNRADFQTIRQQVLARIEEERRKVPLALLAQAYPTPTKAAA